MDLLQSFLIALFCMSVVFGVLITIFFLVSLSSRAIGSIQKIFDDSAA